MAMKADSGVKRLHAVNLFKRFLDQDMIVWFYFNENRKICSVILPSCNVMNKNN